jgi:hypothetical protein
MRSSIIRFALNDWSQACRGPVVLPATLGSSLWPQHTPTTTTVQVAWASNAGGREPLEQDPRTTKPQERAHDTDEATKESIRHAAEGEIGSAVSDVGDMAKNAAKGAKESAKLMYDSVKERMTGGQSGAGAGGKEDLKKGKDAH